jgi:hypothetical protein
VSLVKPTMKSGSRGFIQNLFCKVWTFIQVFTNFGNLPYFLEFKIIEKHLKLSHSIGPKRARGYSPQGRGGLLRTLGRKAGWATACQPSPAGPTACVTHGNAHAPRAWWCGHHAQTTHGTTWWRTRRWLNGGKVLPVSTGGVPGWRRARRRGQGRTRMVGRW